MAYRTVSTAVTPHDTDDNLPEAMDYLYIGTGGDVVLVDAGGTAVTFANAPSGLKLLGAWRRVNSTNTTASDLVAVVFA